MSYTVGIPVMNEEGTILDSISSILDQSMPPLEILVCINGSTDGTSEIIKDLQKKDRRVKPVFSNQGIANAWNVIVANAQTNFIGFTDGDTTVRKSAFEKLYSEFEENPNLTAAGGSLVRLEPSKNTFFTRVSDQEYGINIRNPYLCGGLYMINKRRLHERSAFLGIKLFPPDTINTTQLIALIAEYFHEIKMVEDAVVEINPLLYFKDFVNIRRRISRGRKQLSARYPELYYSSESLAKRFNSYIMRFEQARTLPKKVGAIVCGLFREAIYQISLYEKLPENPQIWEPTIRSNVSLRRFK